jgi:hypothetical protein
MESWEKDALKIAASVVGIGVGAFGLWGSLRYAESQAGHHIHGDVRADVNSACGVNLNDQQWRRLLGTNEWLNYRGTLPSIPWYQNTSLIGPAAMSSAASFVASYSMEQGASVFIDLDGLKGWLAIGFTALLIWAAKILFFRGAIKRFVTIDGLTRGDPLCVTARKIANGLVQSRVAAFVASEVPTRAAASAPIASRPSQTVYGVSIMSPARPAMPSVLSPMRIYTPAPAARALAP